MRTSSDDSVSTILRPSFLIIEAELSTIHTVSGRCSADLANNTFSANDCVKPCRTRHSILSRLVSFSSMFVDSIFSVGAVEKSPRYVSEIVNFQHDCVEYKDTRYYEEDSTRMIQICKATSIHMDLHLGKEEKRKN